MGRELDRVIGTVPGVPPIKLGSRSRSCSEGSLDGAQLPGPEEDPFSEREGMVVMGAEASGEGPTVDVARE